jgi:hypothetical protein
MSYSVSATAIGAGRNLPARAMPSSLQIPADQPFPPSCAPSFVDGAEVTGASGVPVTGSGPGPGRTGPEVRSGAVTGTGPGAGAAIGGTGSDRCEIGGIVTGPGSGAGIGGTGRGLGGVAVGTGTDGAGVGVGAGAGAAGAGAAGAGAAGAGAAGAGAAGAAGVVGVAGAAGAGRAGVVGAGETVRGVAGASRTSFAGRSDASCWPAADARGRSAVPTGDRTRGPAGSGAAWTIPGAPGLGRPSAPPRSGFRPSKWVNAAAPPPHR